MILKRGNTNSVCLQMNIPFETGIRTEHKISLFDSPIKDFQISNGAYAQVQKSSFCNTILETCEDQNQQNNKHEKKNYSHNQNIINLEKSSSKDSSISLSSENDETKPKAFYRRRKVENKKLLIGNKQHTKQTSLDFSYIQSLVETSASAQRKIIDKCLLNRKHMLSQMKEARDLSIQRK